LPEGKELEASNRQLGDLAANGCPSRLLDDTTGLLDGVIIKLSKNIERRSDLLLGRTRAHTSQDVMTSISSVKEEKKDEHLEMDIDLSIRSQRSEKEEKEDEHPEMDIDLSIKGVVSRGVHEEEIAKVDEGLLPPMYNVEG